MDDVKNAKGIIKLLKYKPQTNLGSGESPTLPLQQAPFSQMYTVVRHQGQYDPSVTHHRAQQGSQKTPLLGSRWVAAWSKVPTLRTQTKDLA